ncbi:hypothetical protein [Arthrobacter rhombi]|uniref:hypothetical protein n=1 Tax=Arthrobacter rhombi TaxID=71253 RepID=UPI003FD3159A
MITKNAVGEQVAETVKANMAASGMTRKAIYTKANMSRDTLDRRLDHGESFTIGELVRIAGALRISASSLMEPITRSAETLAA